MLNIPLQKVFVQQSLIHGIGVFDYQDISLGEIIEICPLLKLPIEEKDSLFADYRFWWTEDEKKMFYVIALGYGSFYNHSDTPNGYFISSKKTFTIDFIATKNIKKGDEILVDYGGSEYWSSRNYVDLK